MAGKEGSLECSNFNLKWTKNISASMENFIKDTDSPYIILRTINVNINDYIIT